MKNDVTGRKLSRAKIVPRLPNYRGPRFARKLPLRLRGAQIVQFGTVDADLEGGGLAIDYRLTDKVKRVIFSFNELGMWVSYLGDVPRRPSNRDVASK